MNNGDEAMARTEIMEGFTMVMNAIGAVNRKLDERAAQLEARITQEVGGLRTEMRAGFAQVDRRLARLDDRVSTLENRTAGLEDGVGGLERDMSFVKTHLGITES